MPSALLQLKETDVVKLILDFLQMRSLHISMLALEREAGVINGIFSDDMLFLRQLILDGQWDDVLAFIQPLSDISAFNIKQFQYIINKHKYLELLCIKTETGMQDYEGTIDELVDVLKRLEELCPTKEEYNQLCLLLTLAKLSDSADYKNWNPSNARVECFKDVFILVEKFLPLDKREKRGDRLEKAEDDRLLQLLIKGLLYESCVEHCQQKATSQDSEVSEIKLSALLSGGAFCDADLSLLSWLQALPLETFGCPFEQKNLKINIKPIMKPSLEASWSEQIMVAPIKPLKVFPHSAVPASRKSIDVMSRSLNPQYDGLAHGLGAGRKEASVRASAEFSAGLMSKSFGGFHLTAAAKPRNSTDKNLMHTSIDKLFEATPMLEATTSVILEEIPPSPMPPQPPKSFSSDDGTVTPPKNIGSALATSTPMVSSKSSSSPQQAKSAEGSKDSRRNSQRNSLGDSSELYKEYQKQRQRIEDQLAKQAQLDVLRYQLKQGLVDGEAHNESEDKVKDVGQEKDSEKESALEDEKQGHFMFISASENDRAPKSPKPTLTSTLERKKKNKTDSSAKPASNPTQTPSRVQSAKVHRTGSGRGRSSIPTPKNVSPVKSPKLARNSGSKKPDVECCVLKPAEGDVVFVGESSQIKGQNVKTQGHDHSPKELGQIGGHSEGESQSASHPKQGQRQVGVVSKSSESHSQSQGQLQGHSESKQTRIEGYVQGEDYRSQALPSEETSHRTTAADDSEVSMLLNQANDASEAAGTLSTKQTVVMKAEVAGNKPGFLPVTSLEDPQAVRTVAFHPTGHLYAVGANSKTLRICTFPNLTYLKEDHETLPATVTFKRQKHHKGSIYCVAWSPLGDLIATGSNDKSVKLLRYDAENHSNTGSDMELSFHDGTVRDVVFMQDQSSHSCLLLSGGAGDCKIYVTDCQTGTAIRSMAGHSGHIYSLHTWGGCMFVSGAQDRTARVWDLRAPAAINVVPSPAPGSAFASVCVDPSGRLLASGHEDSSVMLWDVRGNRIVQSYKVHTSDVRSVRFSMNAYYLLSASYDNKVVLTDLHGDLMRPLPSVVVAEHKDKVIQCRWHPSQLAFLTTSADRTVKSWALPVV